MNQQERSADNAAIERARSMLAEPGAEVLQRAVAQLAAELMPNTPRCSDDDPEKIQPTRKGNRRARP